MTGADKRTANMFSTIFSGLDLTGLALMLILSFFLSYSLDLIMNRQGFGIFGNMVIINVQFTLGFVLSKSYLNSYFTLNQHLLIALFFAFLTILALSYLKGSLSTS
tara:strand:- start:451 stop:768 length:318 start_codon:yes stop_codon:yes gene_type:complete